MTTQPTRALSAALFGNEKMAEVVGALERLRPATAQMISDEIRIQHTLVRDVLRRLEKAQIVTSMRVGGSRSALYYEPTSNVLWSAVLALAEHVCRDISTTRAEAALRGE